MHGDFLAEIQGQEGRLIGGLALLSGYINKVRREEENVLYLISGDMVQGSIIDSEYKGISTIEIMNYLAPDVVALGNHEFDYGLAHILFLEKMANFPIVNANLYIKQYNKILEIEVKDEGNPSVVFRGNSILHCTSDLTLQSIQYDLRTRMEHPKLVRQGLVGDNLREIIDAELAEGVLYFEGGEWVRRPA